MAARRCCIPANRFPRSRSASPAAGLSICPATWQVTSASGCSTGDPDLALLQSAGFGPDPGGRVIVSVCSSGAIGRLVPPGVIGLVRYLRGHARPANERIGPHGYPVAVTELAVTAIGQDQ